MVLSSAADSQQPNASSSSQLRMAASGNSGTRGSTAPFKPLHNFPLEDLRWSMSHSRNNNRGAGDHTPPPEERKKPSKFFVRLRGKRVGNPANDGAPAPSRDAEVTVAVPPPSPPPPLGNGDDDVDVYDDDDVAVGTRAWNLRPRRAVAKPRGPTNPNEVGPTGGGGGGGGGEAKKKGKEKEREKERERERERVREREKRERKKEEKREKERVRRERLKEEKKKNLNTNTNNEKESKHERGVSFAITLTKDEIEQDFFAFTGSRPSRRPKKRPRHIQKQLDCVFPGLWLDSITPESYKVDEPPSKPRK